MLLKGIELVIVLSKRHCRALDLQVMITLVKVNILAKANYIVLFMITLCIYLTFV